MKSLLEEPTRDGATRKSKKTIVIAVLVFLVMIGCLGVVHNFRTSSEGLSILRYILPKQYSLLGVNYPESTEEANRIVGDVIRDLHPTASYRTTHMHQRTDGSWFIMLVLDNPDRYVAYSLEITRGYGDNAPVIVNIWLPK